MTESQVEALLRQMSLREPSAELDEKIGACLRVPSPMPAATDSHVRAGGRLVAVAAVCLVIGAAIGHVMGTSSVMSDTALSAGTEPAGHSRAVQDEPSGDGNQVPTAEHKGLDAVDVNHVVAVGQDVPPRVRVGNIPETVLRNQMQGPPVGMLCAMTGHVVHKSREEQCLQCHHGLTTAESKFRREHMRGPQFEMCMLCHDSSVEAEAHGPGDKPLYR